MSSAVQRATAPLVVMANRLPVRRRAVGDVHVWETSPGGLVAALGPVFEAHPGEARWVGWSGIPGEHLSPFEIDGLGLDPVAMSAGEVQLFYEGFCNATIWPLFHDSIVRSAYHRTWWDAYRTVNRRFAERAAEVVDPDGVVWVHDYQLLLVPAELRALRPDVRIGFFLHIPFPSAGLFRQIPWRRELAEGLSGADVVGFQTQGGADNFRDVVERLDVGVVDGDEMTVDGRPVDVRVFPIGVDATRIAATAELPEVRRRAEELREELGNPERILLGVDRLDYTKGIARRLKAVAELISEERLEVPRHVLVQVAEPTREAVPEYAEFRERIDRMVGEINGAHGIVGHPAIHYLHRTQSFEELVALYLAADVMLVTPVRDGMNLVCKEFVAARTDNTGVLVLSEFTGAAESMHAALLVNPYDTDGLKNVIERAAHLPSAEVERRMRLLRESVFHHDVHHWAHDWMRVLGLAPTDDPVGTDITLP
ncbi:MAG: trehalose-6-phosphate synthase [Microthrixaceae bacterium]